MGNTTTSLENVIEVRFDNNCPSFDSYFKHFSDSDQELPLVMFSDTDVGINFMSTGGGYAYNTPPQFQLSGGVHKKRNIDSLSSLGLNDDKIKSINKYVDTTDSELKQTPQSSDYVPRKTPSFVKSEHGTESSTKGTQKNNSGKKKLTNDDSDDEDLEFDEDEMDDTDDDNGIKKSKQARYVSSPDPYNKSVKTLLTKDDVNTDSSVNVLPKYS